jgi:glycosyltransferase involved in cell wall biosynthesis
MKILFIAPLPPPITGHSFASKIFLDYLVKYHQVQIVNLSKESFKSGFNSIERIIQIIKIFWEIWYKKRGVDTIYFTISESIAGSIKDLFIYFICFGSLDKMIIHLHGGAGMKEIMLNSNKIHYKINKYFISRLYGVVVLGKSHYDIYSSIFKKDKIYIVPNFASDELFLDNEEIIDKFKNLQPIRILFLSNFIEGKGYNELIEAYSLLDDNIKNNLIIDFAGGFESENQKNNFLQKVEKIAQFRYHGIVSGIEKKELFKSAHIFCLPTYYSYEGQPITILEAYASGCVVITTNHSGIHDIFCDKLNGFEVEKRSSNSIKNAIKQITIENDKLLPIALFNRAIAHKEFRTSIYCTALLRIIEEVKNPSDK